MDSAENSSASNASGALSVADPSLFVADVCLAVFSLLNLMVNFSLLLLCARFIRGGCHSSSDVNNRRPHYGLHFFIFHCVLSSVLLECIGTLTNVGYLFTGYNILHESFGSPALHADLKKALDFVTYALFNVSHLNFVLLLNVDKLLYVLRPLHYYELMNRKRVCLVCLVTWLVALAMASPSLTYVDTSAQIRQEAILFAMCVVCPASFDLLSAIIVSTLVYRIQLQDSHARLSIKPPRPSGSRRRLFSRTATVEFGNDASLSDEVRNARVYGPLPHAMCENFSRHCRVFLKAFTPIIWTCVTTLPYTATMIYLYFGTKSSEEFYRRWTDPSMFKVLRALGCLYVTYFTGVPLIIIFNNQAYRKRITTLARMVLAKSRDFNRRVRSRTYAAILKAEQTPTASDVTTPSIVTGPAIGNKEGHLRSMLSCTEV